MHSHQRRLNEIQSVVYSRFDPVDFPKNDIEVLLTYMKQDKKNEMEGLNFTLLDCLGGAIINQRLDKSMVQEGLQYYASLL